MRTQRQIDTEIAALTKIKPRVRQTSAFGDNHHDAIDGQIDTLKNRLDENAIYDRFEDEEWAENVKDSAIEAYQWLHEETDDDAPSESWKELVIR